MSHTFTRILLAAWTITHLASAWDLKPSAEKYWNLKKLGLLHQKEPLLSIGHEFHLQQQESSSPGYHAYYYSHNPHQSYSRHQHAYPEVEGRSVSSSSSSSSKYSSGINSNDKKVERNHLKTQSASGCTYKGQRYYHSQSVATSQPCLNCTCQRGFVSCYLRVCPPIKAPEGDDSCFLLKEEGNCCPSLKCSSMSQDTSTYSLSTTNSPVSNSSTSKYIARGPLSTTTTTTSTTSSTTSAPVAMSPVASPYTSFTHKSTYHASNNHERRAESSYASYNKLYPMKSKDQQQHNSLSTNQPPYKQEATYWSSHSPRPSSTASPLRSSSRPYYNQVTGRPVSSRPYSSSSFSSTSFSSSSAYNRRPIGNNTYKTYPNSHSFSSARRPLYPVTSSTTVSSINALRGSVSSSSFNRRPIVPLTLVASSSAAPAVAAIERNKNKISNDFVATSTTVANNLPSSSVSSGSSKNNAFKDSNEPFSFFRLSSILV